MNPKILELHTRAANQYHEALWDSPAAEYLSKRGILDGAEVFKLGYVAEPAPGHEDRIKHHLSIPYITEAGDRKSTRLNSSHTDISRMPSSA